MEGAKTLQHMALAIVATPLAVATPTVPVLRHALRRLLTGNALGGASLPARKRRNVTRRTMRNWAFQLSTARLYARNCSSFT